MEHDLGGSFPFNFDPNGIPFVPKLKGKLSLRSYFISYLDDHGPNVFFLNVFLKSSDNFTNCLFLHYSICQKKLADSIYLQID